MSRDAWSDDQFARIGHLPPDRPGHVGRHSDTGNRLFVEAVIWKFRTGPLDALGNPLAVSLTGGHVHDVTQAPKS